MFTTGNCSLPLEKLSKRRPSLVQYDCFGKNQVIKSKDGSFLKSIVHIFVDARNFPTNYDYIFVYNPIEKQTFLPSKPLFFYFCVTLNLVFAILAMDIFLLLVHSSTAFVTFVFYPLFASSFDTNKFKKFVNENIHIKKIIEIIRSCSIFNEKNLFLTEKENMSKSGQKFRTSH